ncbi:unnamed protein product [Phytomonas sp. Hart1]|nr:unnamed protein product [Phytomonas sp. Hart1]|eukprot:CCW67724.1 unnamed protein product [Phytomonas sp. isolate Hart1]
MDDQGFSSLAFGRSHSVSCDSPIFYPPTQETPESNTQITMRRKEIFDRVYGQIIFPPVLGLFIDSPQVQRLRDLKQVGNTHYVYPSTTHTRFEHCLGVAHLGMRFFKQIFENQAENKFLMKLPDISSDEIVKDLWCVGIAGLCHDLGHGPLSHMFEKYVNEIRASKHIPLWSHEEASVLMVRTIWRNRQDELEQMKLFETDLRFVELLIHGLDPLAEWPENEVGRPPSRRFMTDIIANRRSGLDVDKLDYIQRDSLSCFGSCALSSVERIFQGAYVLEDENGQTEIIYQDKLEGTIEEVFINRARLFRLVYQHRVSQVMDQMTLDAFVAADEFFTIIHEGKEYRLSEIVDHPEAYLQTGDWILSSIRYSTKPELKPARDILNSIQYRHIYKTLGYYTTSSPSQAKAITARDLIASVESFDLKEQMEMWEDETGLCPIAMLGLTIYKASKDLGDVDPLSRIRFFNPRLEPLCPYFPTEQRVTNALDTRDQFRVVAVSRMNLNVEDSNILIDTFKNYAAKQDILRPIGRTETPVRSNKRSRENSNDDFLFPDVGFTQNSKYLTPKRHRTNSQPPVILTHLGK